MTNNELYHYGVKGMKWGKRKKSFDSEQRSQNKTSSKSVKKEQRATPEGKSAMKRRLIKTAVHVGFGVVGATLAVLANKQVKSLPKQIENTGRTVVYECADYIISQRIIK